jgi:dihydroorotate dehydrogenase electron transfer subunit
MKSSCLTDAKVLRNEQIATDIFRITMQAESIAEAASPGQFVMVKAMEKIADPPLLRRPFSIHQATSNGRLQILFKKLGKGTEFLASRQPGDVLNLLGPLGRGFSLPEQPANICLIGGGMGGAPLFYLAKQLSLNLSAGSKLKVLLGAASAKELVVLQKDFASLGASVDTATDDGTAGHHGLVTELLDKVIPPAEKWQVFTCGPHPMMKAIAVYCLEKAWPCQVSLETLMACGISACLGCAVPSARQLLDSNEPYLHVCKDGPVFEAEEVAWI